MQVLEKTGPTDDGRLSFRDKLCCAVAVALFGSMLSYRLYMERPATTKELQTLSPCAKEKAARIVQHDLIFEPLSRSDADSLERSCEKRAKAFAEEKEQIKKLNKQRAALGV